jgi:hypothetical protein
LFVAEKDTTEFSDPRHCLSLGADSAVSSPTDGPNRQFEPRSGLIRWNRTAVAVWSRGTAVRV